MNSNTCCNSTPLFSVNYSYLDLFENREQTVALTNSGKKGNIVHNYSFATLKDNITSDKKGTILIDWIKYSDELNTTTGNFNLVIPGVTRFTVPFFFNGDFADLGDITATFETIPEQNGTAFNNILFGKKIKLVYQNIPSDALSKLDIYLA
jgi:hypothetical protein